MANYVYLYIGDSQQVNGILRWGKLSGHTIHALKKHICNSVRYANYMHNLIVSTERGRRDAVSVIGPCSPGMDLGDLTELPNRIVNSSPKEDEPVKEEKQTEGDLKAEEEDRAKETDADDDESDAADDEEDRAQDQENDDDEDEETESEAPTVQEEAVVPTIIEPTVEQESQVESESEPESELETETEVTEKEEVKEEVEVQSESPAKLESSPPSDSETEVSEFTDRQIDLK